MKEDFQPTTREKFCNPFSRTGLNLCPEPGEILKTRRTKKTNAKFSGDIWWDGEVFDLFSLCNAAELLSNYAPSICNTHGSHNKGKLILKAAKSFNQPKKINNPFAVGKTGKYSHLKPHLGTASISMAITTARSVFNATFSTPPNANLTLKASHDVSFQKKKVINEWLKTDQRVLPGNALQLKSFYFPSGKNECFTSRRWPTFQDSISNNANIHSWMPLFSMFFNHHDTVFSVKGLNCDCYGIVNESLWAAARSVVVLIRCQ